MQPIHLVRVLRLQEGDACVLFNGDGANFPRRCWSPTSAAWQARWLARRDVDNESPLRIALVQGDRARREDGLDPAEGRPNSASPPVLPGAERPQRSEARTRARGEAARALAQRRGVCVRAERPRTRCRRSRSCSRCRASRRRWSRRIASCCDPEADDTIATMPSIEGACVLAVGPEGGWSERDRATLQAAGFTGLRLGPRVLRTETAGIAAIAALQARFGDLG
jgi:16S rRNA (uracil1498-N3)-methyltransferase